MGDKSMMKKFQIAKVEFGRAPTVSEPFAVATSWDYEKFKNPSEVRIAFPKSQHCLPM